MSNKLGDTSVAAPMEASMVAQATTPSRKRYSRAQLMHFRDTLDLTAPPVGYNPSTLRPTDLFNKEMAQSQRGEGMKWNRTRSLGGWPGTNQGSKNAPLPPTNRPMDGPDDGIGGPGRGGRALRSAISWSENQHQQQSGSIPVPDKNFGRRNSRSDAPGRWDNNKDDQLSKSNEKRVPEKWGSYGHRQEKEKPPQREDVGMENPPPEPVFYHGNEPEWMHHKPTSLENAERMKQQRQFAADIEEERKMMRERTAKEGRDRHIERHGDAPSLMTEEEISDFKKQLEAEERGSFTFDSLKEAFRSQGVSNLPPIPTTGISTVDQIEKSMKASAQQQTRPSISDTDKQRMDLLKAARQPNVMQNQGLNIEGASQLLSLLKRPAPTTTFPPMMPRNPIQQPIGGGFPLNIPQQQGGMLAGNNTELQRLFAANQRAGGNLGLPGYAPQQPQVPFGMSNMTAAATAASIPFMQQQTAAAAAQANQRGGAQSHNLIASLMANQQAQQNSLRQKAQIMAHLQQAQQQTPLLHPRADPDPSSGRNDTEDESDLKAKNDKSGLHTNMMGMLTGAVGAGQNQMSPLHSFNIPGNLVSNRPAIPAPQNVFNPSMANLQMGGNPQENIFPGGIPQGGGLGGHPGFFLQNGSNIQRQMGPGLTGLNLGVVRPGIGAPLGSMMDDRQLPVINGPPSTLQAGLLAAQQSGAGGSSSGLNRFFGEHNVGGQGTFHGDAPTVAPVRNRSLEELKNEAQ